MNPGLIVFAHGSRIESANEGVRAVARDLRKRYSDRYRVMSADSGPKALNILTRLAQRAEPVALLVADHRMAQMNGVEFLTIRQFPDVRRELLTADTEAAIGASNVVKLDHPVEAVGSRGPESLSCV